MFISILSVFLLFLVSAKTESSCSVQVSLNLRTEWVTGQTNFYLYDVLAINNGELDVNSGWYFKVVAESGELNIYQAWNLFHLGAGDATRLHAVFSPDSFWSSPFKSSSEYRSGGFISTQRVTLETIVGVDCSSPSESSSESSSDNSASSSSDNSSDGPILCIALATLCPDGSYVSPDPNNNCEVPACPSDSSSENSASSSDNSSDNSSDGPILCIALATLCPDGSYVSPDPNNNCEVPACPSDSSSENSSDNSGGLFCTEEVKICPGGIQVGRDPSNNCEFEECPVRCDVSVTLIARTTAEATWIDATGKSNQVYDISIINTGVCSMKNIRLNFSFGAGTFISSKWNLDDHYKLMNFGDYLRTGDTFLGAGIIVTGPNSVTVELGSKACDCTL